MRYAKIIECRPAGGLKLWLRFVDKSEGVVDLSDIPRTGVFAPWNDPGYFEKAIVDAEGGTVCWPNGADLDPCVLHHKVTGKPLPGQGDGSRMVG
ncbi:MAG: DUF2442 domain-containing protein [Planctomycetota bacterium]